ncbi:uncharacterized protein [Clytia hemisphaerica]|uniref:uncharacterized protein n=1 Tax=Clytia hemisphaerica TaxID=252671 RepID=UPI0034D3A305
MAKIHLTHLPRRIANLHSDLFVLFLRMHKFAASIGFIKKAIFMDVSPKFVQIKGQFVSSRLKHETEKKLLYEHLFKHVSDLKNVCTELNDKVNVLRSSFGRLFSNLLLKRIQASLNKRRIESFKTKNKKLNNLSQKSTETWKKYDIPVINLSDNVLSPIEQKQLSYEAYTDMFTKNVYASKDYTYHNLKRLTNDPNLTIVKGDKDSCVVIMNKADYYAKMQQMIDKGIQDKVYEPSNDTTLDDLKLFQSFLCRNLSKYEHYKDMYPSSSQPARLYGTAKTHKFDNLNDINLENLKFRPIIAQTGTYTYKAAQVIAKYLKPLCSDNKFIIRNTQDFPKLVLDEPKLNENEEYVSYDVESLFTNIPIIDTIN